jgi:hypothetical protein
LSYVVKVRRLGRVTVRVICHGNDLLGFLIPYFWSNLVSAFPPVLDRGWEMS